jgi:capsular polysaccharide biosynthesis protein
MIPDLTRASQTMVAHFVAIDRGATGLWVLHSLFPGRIRIYRNTYHAPVMPADAIRELSLEEREEIERFVDGFTRTAKPVLSYRRATITPEKLRKFAREVVGWAYLERDNEQLTPVRGFLNPFRVRARSLLSRPLWGSIDPQRPFFYFPLHYADDFKIERIIPHCGDQEYLIRQVAQSLPQGYDLVVKEHPYSIGGNPVAMLRRLRRISNVRLVDPFTSSHELMKAASAITVISSTVGIEALLYGKPVLTMGQPYYAGYGLTRDIDSFREIHDAVPALLAFRPDHERVLQFLHAYLRSTYSGSPEWIDKSDKNVAKVANSLDVFARARADQALSVAS